MPPVASAAWRALILLLQALAPGLMPLAVRPDPVTPHLLAARCGSALALLALLAAMVLWLSRARRHAVGALLGLATLGAAMACALRFPSARWPLGAGVLVVGPLLWLTLLAAARTTQRPRLRLALTALWFVGLMADAYTARGSIRHAMAPPPEASPVEAELPDATIPLVDATLSD
ncbi:MAG: hypothetical protein R3A48_18090 [Polyangiales bacterium]